jgi:YlmC/YmxH family sporulation protein
MSSNIKLLSEIERYEIINVNDGEKYNYLANNDIVFDNEGNLKLLVIHLNTTKFSFFGGGNEYLEIPWEYVKKIGSRTIILDADEDIIKRTKI